MHPHSSIRVYRPLLLQCTPYLHFVSSSVTSFPCCARCLFTIVSTLIKPHIPPSQMSPPLLTSLEKLPSALLPVCTALTKQTQPISLVFSTWDLSSPWDCAEHWLCLQELAGCALTSWSQLLAFRRMLWALASMLFKVLNISCWSC